MKKHQIYTRKRHEALARSLEKYIKLQKNMDNFSGAVCGAVGLAESLLLISAYAEIMADREKALNRRILNAEEKYI